jgi:hypothetical protein
MDETAWLAATDPAPMLHFLRAGGRASDRKLRLFAVACCRQIWPLITHGHCQQAVELSERYADGVATPAQLRKAERRAHAVTSEVSFEATVMMRLREWATKDAALATAEVARKRLSPEVVASRARAAVTASPQRPQDQCGLLRDIFGNPFIPTPRVDPTWIRWHDGTVVRIAEGIYQERAFERMGILAGALLDAGCGDEEILSHCRGPGAHVRGCFVLDLLLNKE